MKRAVGLFPLREPRCGCGGDGRAALRAYRSEHLDCYCDEFSFRWDHRSIPDSARTEIAIQKTRGKRLTYKEPIGQ
jgi:hypothetical protein